MASFPLCSPFRTFFTQQPEGAYIIPQLTTFLWLSLPSGPSSVPSPHLSGIIVTQEPLQLQTHQLSFGLNTSLVHREHLLLHQDHSSCLPASLTLKHSSGPGVTSSRESSLTPKLRSHIKCCRNTHNEPLGSTGLRHFLTIIASSFQNLESALTPLTL